MRVRCDDCGTVLFDSPLDDESRLHVHGYRKDGCYMFEIRHDMGRLVAEGTDHLCAEL